MGRAPCCDKASVKRGPWSPQEDDKLKEFIHKFGSGGNWIALPSKAGLRRCGKSCRLRWLNYLRPNIKHGHFSQHEDTIICTLFATIGSRWSVIAGELPGRTDNDIKNYWNTKLKKKLRVDTTQSHHHLQIPQQHQPTNFSSFLHQPSLPCNNYNSATPSPRHTLDLHPMPQLQESFTSPMQNYQNTLQDHQLHGTHKLSHMNGFGSPEAAPDYEELEEIKQLMSTNSSGSIGNKGDTYWLHESRTAEERMLLYYY